MIDYHYIDNKAWNKYCKRKTYYNVAHMASFCAT